MSEVTDAFIQLLGPETGLILVVLLAADAMQTRYLAERIGDVDDDLDEAVDRIERVEDVHISTDGAGEEVGHE